MGQVQPATKIEEIALPRELEEICEIVQAAVEQVAPITVRSLTGTAYTATVVEKKTVSYDGTKELMEYFQKKDYITLAGKIKDTMKNALKAGTLEPPKKYEAARGRFEAIIASANRKPPVRDASRDVTVRLNKQVMLSPEFLELWGKIKQKTTYHVSIDTEELVKRCVKALREMPKLQKTRLVSQTADLHLEQAGVSHVERETRFTEVASAYRTLPDLVTILSAAALFTPATVNRILLESGRCGVFLNDPDVKMFFKIPERFKVKTPIGAYNPDWAVYLIRKGEERLHFILETKGTTNLFNLRTPEQLKIHCGKKHFKALENGVEMCPERGHTWGKCGFRQ